MIAKTRNVVAGSAVVLGLGLGTGLFAYYVGLQPGGASQNPADLRFVPAGVTMVAAADVHAIMLSPLRERLRGAMGGRSRGHENLAAQTGINIDTDIDRVVVASGKIAGDQGRPTGMVVARGRFDVVKIEAFMREKGGQVAEQSGKRLIVGSPVEGKPTLSLAFMEPGLIAFGSEEMVRSAITLANGGASVTTDEPIMRQVQALAPGDAWVVGRFDELTASTAFPAGVGDKLPPIQWFSASVSVDSGVRGVVRAEARDDASGESLRDVVRGVVALARLQSGRYPQFDSALQSLTLGGSGKTVDLGFDVSAEAFSTLGIFGGSRPSVQ